MPELETSPVDQFVAQYHELKMIQDGFNTHRNDLSRYFDSCYRTAKRLWEEFSPTQAYDAGSAIGITNPYQIEEALAYFQSHAKLLRQENRQ